MWYRIYHRSFSLQKDLLAQYLWYFHNNYKKLTGLIIVPHGTNKGDCYVKKTEWQALMRKIAQEIITDKDFYNKSLRQFTIYKTALVNKAKRLAAVKKLSNQQLLKRYREYYKEYLRYPYMFWVPWAINETVEPWFRNKLVKLLPRKHEQVYQAISYATKDTNFNKQFKELLSLKINKKLNKKSLVKHAKKYGWLVVYNYNEHPWQAKDFVRQLKGVRSPLATLNRMRRDLYNARRNFKQAIKQIKNNHLKNLARILNEYVYLRTERIDVFRQALFYAQPFYRRLEKELGLPWGGAVHLTITEIENYLQKSTQPDLAEIKRRIRDRYILWCSGGETVRVIIDEKEKEYVLNKVLKLSDFSKLNQVNGQPAYNGIIRGKVKIVLNVQQVAKVKAGEILIASMTHPEYLLAIKKAAAIVTDEGGITCHASVIAREFKKPTVIGTKFASKVFTDGDLVEVDANRGIVKIIKKK